MIRRTQRQGPPQRIQSISCLMGLVRQAASEEVKPRSLRHPGLILLQRPLGLDLTGARPEPEAIPADDDVRGVLSDLIYSGYSSASLHSMSATSLDHLALMPSCNVALSTIPSPGLVFWSDEIMNTVSKLPSPHEIRLELVM